MKNYYYPKLIFTRCLFSDFNHGRNYGDSVSNSEKEKSSYESSDDENIDEFLPLNKRTYGSFDQTTLPYEKLPRFSDEIENDSEQLDLAINALVKSVVASGKRQNLNF